jgi:S-adenosylmethionine hydrolase
MVRPIITLTTDFGLRDPYVAEMKAVILSICPEVRIVDVSNEIEKFSVKMGAFVLASASPYFPEDAVHVAIVDPTVGTSRRQLLIRTRKGFFVGPDNGVLALAADSCGIERIYEITNRKLMLSRISSTFHGRDIFASAAAHLANGVEPAEFGPVIPEIVRPSFAKIAEKKGELVGEVLHVDGFGSIVTNFRERELESMNVKKRVNIKLKSTKLKLKLCKAYAEEKKHRPLAIIGSHNFLEISVNQGNAARTFKIENGDRVILYRS